MLYSFVESILGTIAFVHIDYTPQVEMYAGILALRSLLGF